MNRALLLPSLWMFCVACQPTVGLGGLEDGRIDIARGHFDGVAETSEIQIELWNRGEACLDLSAGAEVEVDGSPARIVWGGAYYDILDMGPGCSIYRFWIDDVPLVDEATTSTVVVRDRGVERTFRVPHLRTRHSLDFSPIVAGESASVTYAPELLGATWWTDSGLNLNYQWILDHDASELDPVGATLRYEVPADLCVAGDWTVTLPGLDVPVEGDAGLRATAWVGLGWHDQPVEVGDDAPACEVEADDLQLLPQGTAVHLPDHYVYSPVDEEGFFAGGWSGAWVSADPALTEGLQMGDGVHLFGTVDHGELVLTHLERHSGIDEYVDGIGPAVDAHELADLDGELVHLVHAEVRFTPDGIFAEGVRLDDRYLDLRAHLVHGEEVYMLSGMVRRGTLAPRTADDIVRD